jgi:hypothetical protein
VPRSALETTRAMPTRPVIMLILDSDMLSIVSRFQISAVWYITIVVGRRAASVW